MISWQAFTLLWNVILILFQRACQRPSRRSRAFACAQNAGGKLRPKSGRIEMDLQSIPFMASPW
jgi:hypothetical protein